MGKWGGYHTEFAHLARGFAGNDRALAEEVGEALLASGLLAEKPSVGQRHVFLNPRRAADIHALIERGDMPADLRLCRGSSVPGCESSCPRSARSSSPRARSPRRASRPTRPDKLAPIASRCARWGPTPAAGYSVSAIRRPDEAGARRRARDAHLRGGPRAHQCAGQLAEDPGIGEGDGVAILCRNHRGFIDATVACSKLGAHALYLNTAFAGPQITEVCEREKPIAIVYDAEFAELVHEAGAARKRFIAWTTADKPQGPAARGPHRRAATPPTSSPPTGKGRVVILTSGTTGTPKGAQRRQPESLDPAAALFSKIPLRAREPTMIAAPMFHSWGFAHFTLGMALGSTLVLRRKFDPEDTLSATAQHECTALVVVPVML